MPHPLLDQFDSIITWTKEKGQIKNNYTYKDLTDFSFIGIIQNEVAL